MKFSVEFEGTPEELGALRAALEQVFNEASNSPVKPLCACKESLPQTVPETVPAPVSPWPDEIVRALTRIGKGTAKDIVRSSRGHRTQPGDIAAASKHLVAMRNRGLVRTAGKAPGDRFLWELV